MNEMMLKAMGGGHSAEHGGSSLAGPQVSPWQMSRALSLLAKPTKSNALFMQPGSRCDGTKAKMTVIRMDLPSVTQGKGKTREDNREPKRQHTHHKTVMLTI